MDALPPCDPPPIPPRDSTIPGIILPEDAYLTISETQGELTTANGWVPLAPVEVRGFYEEPPAGWRVLTLEDEGIEAEVLVASTTTRLFVQAVATCPRGSWLYLRVIPEAVIGG